VKKPLKISVLAVAAAAAVALVPAPAQALGSAFSCDAVTYQSIQTQLKIGTVDTAASPAVLTYADLGAAHSEGFNAGGYNTVDNYIYALTAAPTNLIKIASDGSYQSVGSLSGADASHSYLAGDVSTDGLSLITVDYNDKSVWSVDLATATGTQIGTLTSAPSTVDFGDIAIVTSGGTTTAYGFDTVTGALVSFDPTQDPIAISVNASVSVAPGSPKGAVWTDSSGNLTTFANATGDVYGIDNPSSATPTVGKVASGTPAAGNDGMKCALSASAFPAPTAALADTGMTTEGKVALATLSLGLLNVGLVILLVRRRYSSASNSSANEFMQ
jgi:hypothetical protein